MTCEFYCTSSSNDKTPSSNYRIISPYGLTGLCFGHSRLSAERDALMSVGTKYNGAAVRSYPKVTIRNAPPFTHHAM
jgi:hypothetical protein